PVEEVIRGHLGTIKFMKDGFELIPDSPQGGAGVPARLEEAIKGEYVDCHPPKGRDSDTAALWLNFLDCVRTRNRHTLSTPELGAAGLTTGTWGVQPYRDGLPLFWNRQPRKPVPADSTGAKRWEDRGRGHGKPNQIIGWQAGETGSLLRPPEYQKLAG